MFSEPLATGQSRFGIGIGITLQNRELVYRTTDERRVLTAVIEPDRRLDSGVPNRTRRGNETRPIRGPSRRKTR